MLFEDALALRGIEMNPSMNVAIIATVPHCGSINKRMIKQLDWWYDRQMPRFLEQVVRAFSGFQYQTGRRTMADGTVIQPQLKMVPCTMAYSSDRMVGHIMRNNSENTTMATPRITVSHTNLTGRRQDLQHPGHVSTVHVKERLKDGDSYVVGTEQGPGRSYTVDRLMPRPFEMGINLDIWTSNLDQKYQLAEQILTVCYPDFAIQNSDTAVDWSALTMMELTDINWSSRGIPVGTDSEIDVMTFTFRIPFWLSPPARVTQQRVIEQIITNISAGEEDAYTVNTDPLSQHITTPGNYQIEMGEGIARLLGPEGALHDPAGNLYDWRDLFKLYGKTLKPTLSKIRLKTSPAQIEDWSTDIIGTLQHDESNVNQLFWQLDPDTLPANTLAPILGVVNPLRTMPGGGLPDPAVGQRYLLTHDIGPSVAWGNLTAQENDIIECREDGWYVVFRPTRGAEVSDYVLNLRSGRQLRWDGDDWVLTIDGHYMPGYWTLVI